MFSYIVLYDKRAASIKGWLNFTVISRGQYQSTEPFGEEGRVNSMGPGVDPRLLRNRLGTR